MCRTSLISLPEIEAGSMKFWMSGEVQDDVSYDFCRLLNRVEASLNSFLENRSYGSGLLEWNFIPIILPEDGPSGLKEVKRYKKRDKTCEFRLRVDHARFKESDSRQQTILFCEALLRSLALLESMNIKDFDVSALRVDFVDFAKQHEWLVMKCFLFDAALGRNISSTEPIEMNCDQVLSEWDGLSRASGTFLGIVNLPGQVLQFMWEESEMVLIDVPLLEKGGSLTKESSFEECRELITRIYKGENPLSLSDLRFVSWK
jgi:hypothetical protein